MSKRKTLEARLNVALPAAPNHVVQLLSQARLRNLTIALTSGSFDPFHTGHAKYLEMAAQFGDVLVVGVDRDEKVRFRKGLDRPRVPEGERLITVADYPCVAAALLKPLVPQRWATIRAICPDVLVASRETYTISELAELKSFCREIMVLGRIS